MNKSLVLLVAGVVLFGWSSFSQAEEPAATTKKASKDERLWPKGPGIAELKGLGFDDAMIAKAKEAVEPINKKFEAVAADAPDAKKTKAELNDERKKVVLDLAPADKKDAVKELLSYHPKKEKQAENANK